MALGTAQAEELGRLAEERGLVLGVNHNATFLPGMARLQRELATGRLGQLEHLSLVHRAPLRQLEAGQFGHFMFRTEANILWEQGVHLFSVVHQFLGPCRDVQVELGEGRLLPTGTRFMDRWVINLVCAGGTAQVLMELGCHLAETSCQVFASDAAVRMDLLLGSYQRVDKTRWPDGFDRARNLIAQGAGLLGQGLGALVDYGTPRKSVSSHD